MKYEPMFEDAPSPSPKLLARAGLSAARLRRRMWIFKKVFPFVCVIFPVLMAVLAWRWGASLGSGLSMRIFLSVAATSASLLTCYLLYPPGEWAQMGEYLQYAENPLSNQEWLEVEELLQRHPEEIEGVSDWVAQYDGVLRVKHIWELRRRYLDDYALLDVLEVCDVNEKPEENKIGARDILEGRLMALFDRHKIKENTAMAAGTGRVARL